MKDCEPPILGLRQDHACIQTVFIGSHKDNTGHSKNRVSFYPPGWIDSHKSDRDINVPSKPRERRQKHDNHLAGGRQNKKERREKAGTRLLLYTVFLGQTVPLVLEFKLGFLKTSYHRHQIQLCAY